MLKLANINDIEQLVELENKMFDETKYFRLSKNEFLKLLNKKSTLLLVWIEDNIIIGYALAIIINKKHLWFNSLAVSKEFQSTKIAKELFDSIENYAIKGCFDSIILEIRQDNKALLRRYKGFKYSECQIIESYYPDGSNAIRMTKKISKED
ncbi:MAG: hypothetical protein KU28_04575 [Sulfurovum sp. PC08-66]|jgi:ribosomal protein S18 acetylase RimI-like enzyme|nr:MAG: hypothetical protein KU28_04575 [Sulfurovum sp. PC08-66]